MSLGTYDHAHLTALHSTYWRCCRLFRDDTVPTVVPTLFTIFPLKERKGKISHPETRSKKLNVLEHLQVCGKIDETGRCDVQNCTVQCRTVWAHFLKSIFHPNLFHAIRNHVADKQSVPRMTNSQSVSQSVLISISPYGGTLRLGVLVRVFRAPQSGLCSASFECVCPAPSLALSETRSDWFYGPCVPWPLLTYARWTLSSVFFSSAVALLVFFVLCCCLGTWTSTPRTPRTEWRSWGPHSLVLAGGTGKTRRPLPPVGYGKNSHAPRCKLSGNRPSSEINRHD